MKTVSYLDQGDRQDATSTTIVGFVDVTGGTGGWSERLETCDEKPRALRRRCGRVATDEVSLEDGATLHLCDLHAGRLRVDRAWSAA
jgi:hypothetical protein